MDKHPCHPSYPASEVYSAYVGHSFVSAYCGHWSAVVVGKRSAPVVVVYTVADVFALLDGHLGKLGKSSRYGFVGVYPDVTDCIYSVKANDTAAAIGDYATSVPEHGWCVASGDIYTDCFYSGSPDHKRRFYAGAVVELHVVSVVTFHYVAESDIYQ